MEDLLTSSVFGPLRYLPAGTAPLQLLAQAVNVLGNPTSRLQEDPTVAHLLTTATQTPPHVQFWPRLGQSEPDLMFTWRRPGAGRFILLLEIKYLSGKSGDGVEEDDEGQVAVSDQLGREYQDLCAHLGANDRGALLYLTAHPGIPRQDIASSLATITPDPRADLYWLSWIDLYRAVRSMRAAAPLEPWVDTLWADIQQLLERKGLTGLRHWHEILSGNHLGRHMDWYQSRVRKMDYLWPQAEPAQAPSWYHSKKRMGYEWPTNMQRSTTSVFYLPRGDTK